MVRRVCRQADRIVLYISRPTSRPSSQAGPQPLSACSSGPPTRSRRCRGLRRLVLRSSIALCASESGVSSPAWTRRWSARYSSRATPGWPSLSAMFAAESAAPACCATRPRLVRRASVTLLAAFASARASSAVVQQLDWTKPSGRAGWARARGRRRVQIWRRRVGARQRRRRRRRRRLLHRSPPRARARLRLQGRKLAALGDRGRRCPSSCSARWCRPARARARPREIEGEGLLVSSNRWRSSSLSFSNSSAQALTTLFASIFRAVPGGSPPPLPIHRPSPSRRRAPRGPHRLARRRRSR